MSKTTVGPSAQTEGLPPGDFSLVAIGVLTPVAGFTKCRLLLWSSISWLSWVQVKFVLESVDATSRTCAGVDAGMTYIFQRASVRTAAISRPLCATPSP